MGSFGNLRIKIERKSELGSMASVMGLPPGMSRVTNHALARATAAGGRNRSSRFRAMQANIQQQSKRTAKCQAWKIPAPKIHQNNLPKRPNFVYDYTNFEFFCPACNITFRCFEEYQSHVILKEQERPYRDEIRDTVRYMKEVVEAIPHQEPEKMESNDSFPDSANLAKIQMQKSKIRRRRNMHTFANFSMQLEMLQNRIDYAEENSDYSNKKFAVNSNPKSKFAKKYFDLRTVTLQIKEAKMRVQEMQRKREYREILRGRIIPTGVSTAVATNAIAKQSSMGLAGFGGDRNTRLASITSTIRSSSNGSRNSPNSTRQKTQLGGTQLPPIFQSQLSSIR